ncbi:hypothetical protein PsorP6_011323 [Peronosclerospora sorghi]|uniref:Uncharacterized protein n=1 Tax=Peronosclerospora sorghi TaxID=230839 RepID=A0ACC0WHC1_9STRA|nr:hypothetical protein PsorP6_011323 [Peronosclerospora sorghi]
MKLVCLSAIVLLASAHATFPCDESKLTEPCAMSNALEHLSARRSLRAKSPTAMDDEDRERIFDKMHADATVFDEVIILERVSTRLKSIVAGPTKSFSSHVFNKNNPYTISVASHVFNKNNPYTKAFEALGLQNVDGESLFSQPELATCWTKRFGRARTRILTCSLPS